jgi:hypothetical protein
VSAVTCQCDADSDFEKALQVAERIKSETTTCCAWWRQVNTPIKIIYDLHHLSAIDLASN